MHNRSKQVEIERNKQKITCHSAVAPSSERLSKYVSYIDYMTVSGGGFWYVGAGQLSSLY